MADTDILKNTITIAYEGDDYEFRIPSLFDEMKIGVRARDIRRKIDPGSGGSDFGLDQNTLFMNRACATFETMLLKASTDWPFSKGPTGPAVDSEQFPKEKAAVVIAVYQELQEKLMTFRAGRSTDKSPDPDKAVASQQSDRQQGSG